MKEKQELIARAHPGQRVASCAYGCGAVKISDSNLAFFEKDKSTERCAHCGCVDEPHGNGRITDHKFEPSTSMPVDAYYCGCRGWD